MAQRAIELILAKQLAGHLSVPVFLVSPDGDLAFYNEAAELLLGIRFNETGPMGAEDWGTRFAPRDASGVAIPVAELPLSIAFSEHRPAEGEMWIQGLDGGRRHLHVTAVPLTRGPDLVVGALAIFWEQAP